MEPADLIPTVIQAFSATQAFAETRLVQPKPVAVVLGEHQHQELQQLQPQPKRPYLMPGLLCQQFLGLASGLYF